MASLDRKGDFEVTSTITGKFGIKKKICCIIARRRKEESRVLLRHTVPFSCLPPYGANEPGMQRKPAKSGQELCVMFMVAYDDQE